MTPADPSLASFEPETLLEDDRARSALDTFFPRLAAEAAEKPPKGGKKNKKKPTPEAIERKRRRRKRKQDFETARAARRASFIEGLAPSDYDALEALILRVEPGADAVEAWATGTRPGWWRTFVSESL